MDMIAKNWFLYLVIAAMIAFLVILMWASFTERADPYESRLE